MREGRRRLSYLLDAVPSDEPEATEDDLVGDDGSLDVSAEAVDPRLELVAALSAEIAGLARKRIAALARGTELSRREHRRLEELLSRAMADIAGLHLQQDRISDLVAEVDTDARSLCRSERELLRLAESCGIARAEVIDRLFGRELDPDWIGEAASLSDRGWCALNASGSLVTVPSRSRRRVSEKRTRSRGASRPLAHSFSFLGRSGLAPGH